MELQWTKRSLLLLMRLITSINFWDRYLAVNKRLGDKVWGYMELDQGGAKNKRITRAKLHDLGINPIPVWHLFKRWR